MLHALASRPLSELTRCAMPLALAMIGCACQHEPAERPAYYGNIGANYASWQPAPPYAPEPLAVFTGLATYYSSSLAGNHTASGGRYDPNAFTAAHRSLAFGTHLRVTRLDNARAVVVEVNDRGPFGDERRVLDLSHAAACELGMLKSGVVSVRAEVLDTGPLRPSRPLRRGE
jgi:rare lipoprotein A